MFEGNWLSVKQRVIPLKNLLQILQNLEFTHAKFLLWLHKLR